MNVPFRSPRRETLAAAPAADYLDVSWGQAHRLISQAEGAAEGSDAAPPLYALHGTAYSGRTFLPLMAELPGRRLVALDTPGYGGSTRPPSQWTIPQYADALAEAMLAGGDGRIDLLGYHTGALIALQIAADHPSLVRRLILIGVPYFPDPQERAAWRARLVQPMRLTETLGQFDERWDFLVTNRAPGASLEQGFAHFVDELRAWPFGFWAHEGAFTFDPRDCLARVRQEALILNPATPLAEPSRRAAADLAHATLVELADLGHGSLDIGAGRLAEAIRAFEALG